MLNYVEHIRKLTIKFICLFQFRFSNNVTISPLKWWDTLSVFLLTIYVSIEVSGISLNVTKLMTCKPCCILTSAFISLLKVSNFDLSLLLPVFFAFSCVLLLLRIFLLISGVIQGTEDTDLLVLEPDAVARSEASSLGMQAAPSSIPTSGTFLRGDLVMKTFLRPFSLFRWFKKSSCQLLAKEYALSTGKLPRRLAKEQSG